MAEKPTRAREEIAFGRRVDWATEGALGTVRFGPEEDREFRPLHVTVARTLLERGLLDPRSRHNGAPPAGAIIEWCEEIATEYRAWQFDIGLVGYMVDPDRMDSRVGVEGLTIDSAGPIPESLQGAVAKRFDPDWFDVDDFSITIWWD